MKRILCLIESLGSGGAERQLTGLAAMLKQKDYEVEVWYYVNKDFYLTYLQNNGVVGRYLPEAVNPRKRFFALRKHIKDYNPNTVISFSTAPSMITCLLKFFGAKYNLIVSERNTTQQLTSSEKLKFFLYRWSNTIVPNSQSQCNYIKKHFDNLSSKVNVITNFVDTNKFVPREKEETEHEELRMVCVGRLMPQKNIPLFIEAIKEVVNHGKKIQVDWFGHDPKNEYSEECHKAVQENHLEEIFVFHAPSSNIHEEYKKADVFCLPSLYEGYPNVICEAMSCGLPILCSNVSDNPYIVKAGENGLLFDPLVVNSIVSTIDNYIELPKGMKITMGKKSREISLELFSYSNFLKKYLEIV